MDIGDILDYHEAALEAARIMLAESPGGTSTEVTHFLQKSRQLGMSILEFDRHGIAGVLHICFKATEGSIGQHAIVEPVAQITWPTGVHSIESAQVAIRMYSDMLVLASTVMHQLRGMQIVDKKLTGKDLDAWLEENSPAPRRKATGKKGK